MADLVTQQAAVEGAARDLRGAVASPAAARYYLFPSTCRRRQRRGRRPSELETIRREASTRASRDRTSAAGVPPGVADLQRAARQPAHRFCRKRRTPADLLRRVQTLAVQSSLTIRGFKPQADHHARACTPSGRSALELEGTLSQPRRLPRSRQQVAAHHQREWLWPIARRTEGASSQTIAVTCTATTFVLLDPEALRRSPAEEGREEGAEKDRMKLLLLPTYPRARRLESDGGARADTGRGAGAGVDGSRASVERPVAAAGLRLLPGWTPRSVRQPRQPGRREAGEAGRQGAA